MLIEARQNFEVAFRRKGGSIITAQLDVWQAVPGDWKLVDTIRLDAVLKPQEATACKLPPGQYTCVFQCFVQESLNGVYAFALEVGGTPVYQDHGDVNTTPARNDAKAYRDQFVLAVA